MTKKEIETKTITGTVIFSILKIISNTKIKIGITSPIRTRIPFFTMYDTITSSTFIPSTYIMKKAKFSSKIISSTSVTSISFSPTRSFKTTKFTFSFTIGSSIPIFRISSLISSLP